MRMMKRRILQIVSTFGLNGYYPSYLNKAIYQGSFKQICAPVLNCYSCPGAVLSCPVGTLQHFILINQGAYYIFGFFAILGMIVGRMACGWLCPFGFVQDLLYKVRSAKISIPKWLTHLKYVILIGFLFVFVQISQEPWFSKLCPNGILVGGIPFAFISVEIRDMIKVFFWLKLGILISFLALFVITKRPFCRTICPAGTVYSYFNNFSAFQMTVDERACTRCNRCQKTCPMDIRIYDNPHSVDCIRCLECTRCPAVGYEPFWKAVLSEQPAGHDRRPGPSDVLPAGTGR
jgi:ferredoxin-type protein NapH